MAPVCGDGFLDTDFALIVLRALLLYEQVALYPLLGARFAFVTGNNTAFSAAEMSQIRSGHSKLTKFHCVSPSSQLTQTTLLGMPFF